MEENTNHHKKTKTDKTKALKYLPKHNWDLETAIESCNKEQFEEFQKALLNSHQSQQYHQGTCSSSECENNLQYLVDFDDLDWNYDEDSIE